MEPQELVGRWSAGAVHTPGAQSDNLLEFLAGGTGQATYLTALSSEVCEFTWSLAGDRLTMDGTAAWLEISRPHERRESAADLHVVASVQVQEEPTWQGTRRVLRLDLHGRREPRLALGLAYASV